MKITLLVLLWFWIATPEPRETHATWEGTQEESFIKFTIRNLGLTVEGQFDSFTTTVDYNKAQPASSRFSATIQVISINTGINKRDDHLLQEAYFHVEKYPTITFQSTSVSSPDPSRLTVKGDLTIKGKTLPVELAVAIKEVGGKTQFSISGELDRRDFGVGGSSWVMSDDVYLNLYVEN
ncbi:Polyisoprenoid-binding protein YceI [Cyclobacterium xiamenense]|uniref:Polyisoprenoid-binding protein YceI n=1 Tax=Cyclobacterium xiamenense TaxID=1297121 RepID=A0A1H6WG74_9BACT|nr:YceI family protein [Cyclobacterium xiamenense]SEJ11335.1 Polyisoprenoid-binding protein YceI [Cyclobacterium xiamenense]